MPTQEELEAIINGAADAVVESRRKRGEPVQENEKFLTGMPSMALGMPAYKPASIITQEPKKPEQKPSNLGYEPSKEEKENAKKIEDAAKQATALRLPAAPAATSEFPAIESRKQAILGAVESAAKAVSFEEPAPIQYDSSKELHSLTPDKVTSEILEKYKSVLDPKELESWPEWFPKTKEQHRAVFDQKHADTSAKDVWNLGVKTAKAFADTLVRSESGVEKAASMALFEGPGAYGSITDPKEWARYGGNLTKLATVPAVTAVEAAENVVQTATNAGLNGLRVTDWLQEKAYNLTGHGITRDEAFDRYYRRAKANEYWAHQKVSDPNVFTRTLFGDPLGRYIGENLVYSVNSVISPSVEDRLARHNGDREAALREKQLDDLQSTQEVIANFRKDAAQQVPDTDISEFVSFTPAGMMSFDIYGRALRAGLSAASKARRFAQTAGKTREEIAAIDNQAARDALASELRQVRAARKPGAIESGLGKAADKIEAAKETVTGILEEVPVPFKAVGSALGGGAVGALTDEESPIKGFAKGAAVGIMGYPVAKAATKAAGIAAQAPRLGQAFLEGRRLAGGEAKTVAGISSAIKKAEELGMDPIIAKKLADKGIPAARAMDWTAQNVLDMARGNVHGATLAAAVGILENKDPEQIAEMMGQGVFWHMSGEVMKNLTGVSQSRLESHRKRQNAAAVKFYASLDRESRNHLGKLTDWNVYTASVRNFADQAISENANAKVELATGMNAELPPEQIQKLQDRVTETERIATIRKAQLANAEAAGPETAKMYGDQIRYGLADMMNSINGSMTPGKNVELKFQTQKQLLEDVLFNNRDKMLTPLEEAELKNIVEGLSGQRAFHARNGGEYQLSSGKVVNLFNPNKTRVNINMDRVFNRVLAGESVLNAAAHEIGHAFWESKEFREQNAEVINRLFGTQRFDDAGRLMAGEPGLFSNEALVDRFKSDYAAEATGGVEHTAKLLGLWDPATNDVDPKKTADYMRAEIMAELVQGGAQGGIKLGDGPKAWLAPLVDWATIKHKNSAAAKTLREFVGLKGAKPWQSELLGQQFSGEDIEATKKALKSVADLNGDISAAETIPHRKISETEIRSNEAVADQFKDGLFATEKVAMVVDSEGNPVVDKVTGQPVPAIPLSDQNVFEGVWENRENDQGEPTMTQTSGYGTFPKEVSDTLGDIPVPQGGRIVVTTRLKRDSSGSLQMLTPEQARVLNRERGNLIRQAMEGAPDRDYPGRLSPQSADRLSFGGVLSPEQVKALKALPETVIPYSLKRRIIEFNNLLLRDQGDGMVGLYAQAMDAKGRYQSFAPKIVDFVPIGLNLSKDGNFLFNMFSKTGMREKLRLWERDTPERLSLWKGDKDAFMDDLKKVLENWKPTPELPAGKPGETGLDADPAIAISKKNRINDYLNMYRKTEEASLYATPNRTTLRRPIRRMTKEEKLDKESSDPNTLIRSYRADRFHDLAATSDEPLRVNYGKALYNLLPEGREPQEDAPRVFGPGIKRGLQRFRFMPANFAPELREKEMVTDAVYVNPRTGVISSGKTHLEANVNAPKEPTDRESAAYQFRTSTGRLVSREEAFKLAQEAGQLKEPVTAEDKFNTERGVLHAGMFEPPAIKPVSASVSFMPSDAEHAAAHEAGDGEKAREMVRKAAEKAGGRQVKPTAIVSPQYISPRNEITNESQFELNKSNFEKNGWTGRPLLVAEDFNGDQAITGSHRLLAAKDAGVEKIPIVKIDLEQYQEWLDKNPSAIVVDVDGFLNNTREGDQLAALREAKKEGFKADWLQPAIDLLHIEDESNWQSDYKSSLSSSPFIVGKEIKSADPFTYDDSGKLIPLSERFNPTSSDIRFMPELAVVPERFTGTKEEDRRGKYVEPPKFFKKFNISQYEKGGKFFDAETGDDVTNKTYENASIAVVNGKPSLVANNESENIGSGPLFKTNLFKQKAGWKWVSENAPETSTIVSVEGQGKHLYTLQADFQNGVTMARYPDKVSEPRLRPTGRGNLSFGEQVGTIDIRGKQHPVYDRITIERAPELLSGIQFMPEKKAAPGALEGIKMETKEEERRFFFTTSTERDAAIAELVADGAEKDIERLNRNSILHAMTGIKDIDISIENSRGVYKGDKEVSAITTVKAKRGADMDAVRSRFMDLAKIFKQMEVLEEKVGGGKEELLNTVDEDGFKHVHSATIQIGKLKPEIIEEARKKAGIEGLTLANGRVELINRGNDNEFIQRQNAFREAIIELGGDARSIESGVAAIRRFSENPEKYAGTVGYDDPSLHLQTERGAGGAEYGRLNTPLARKLAQLGAFDAPAEGKRNFFEAKDVTKEQAKFQAEVAKVFDSLPDNDMQSGLTQEAYAALVKEIKEQYLILTSGPDGLKFTSKLYSEGGEPYKNSDAAIRDIRENNRLYFLKTDADAFGPPGADFSGHPLLKDSGLKDANGVPLLYNDLFRAVHDTIAHGMFGSSFGPVGEEGAYHVHVRTIQNPLARWAMMTETRGQNSWVNYRPEMLKKNGMPLQKGDAGYIPLQERGFAVQKAALLPLEYALTGDKEVDKPIMDLMKTLGTYARGSRPATKQELAIEARVKKGVIAEQKEASEFVKGAKGIITDSIFVDGNNKVKTSVEDVPPYYLMSLGVRPLPNIEMVKEKGQKGGTPKDLLKLAQSPEKYDAFAKRLIASADTLSADPGRFVSPKGYSEFMRENGITGTVLSPPSMLKMLIETPQQYLDLLTGGFHEEKTVKGGWEAANGGLNGVMEMRALCGPEGPPLMVTALHHLWGTLSKQLPPLDQEACWLRLISDKRVLGAIQNSIDGTFDPLTGGWREIVASRLAETNNDSTQKFGNNAKSNANSFLLMLSRHNGRWNEVSDLYKTDDPAVMRTQFWGLNHGPSGIKNKVQGFIGLTFGVKAAVLDRWRWVELHLPMAMKLAGKSRPKDYFEYTGVKKDTPQDPTGIYKNYGTAESSHPAYSTTLYTGLERATNAAINNYAPLRDYLGAHADAGGLHWHVWNAIKNESVGHSSLDLTKSYLQKYGRNMTPDSFHQHLMNSAAYVEGENNGQIVRLIMTNGEFKVERQ